MSLQDENHKKLVKLIYCMRKKENYKNQVQAILDSGYDIDCALPAISSTEDHVHLASGSTAVHFAAQSKHAESYLRLLLQRGADVTRQNTIGSPLHLALKTDTNNDDSNYCILNLLLDHQVKSGNATNISNRNGVTHFHLACRIGNFCAVKFFLEAGVSVHEIVNTDHGLWFGFSPLHLAIKSHNEDVIQLLLRYGANHNCVNDSYQRSPLNIVIGNLISSRKGRKDSQETLFYERLLDALLRPNENDLLSPVDSFGLLYFHKYCLIKHVKFTDLEYFLNLSIDINTPVSFDYPKLGGYTPLHFALDCGNKKIAKWLLKRGANLFARNARGETPLDLCLKTFCRKPLAIVDILKSKENLESIEFDNGLNLFDVISAFDDEDKLFRLTRSVDVNSAIPLNSPIWPGVTILHLSIMLTCIYDVPSGYVPPFVIFLDREPNMMIQDANGTTAFHLLFYSRFVQNFVHKLTDEYMDASINPIDENTSLSHFHLACLSRNIEVVRLFLRNGENANLAITTSLHSNIKREVDRAFNSNLTYEIRSGSTALHIAVILKSKELAKLLLEYNADPLVLDSEGFTWMHRAFVSEHFDLFKPLLFSHPNALRSNPIAPGGLSHFHIACSSENLAAVKALLPFVADINEPITSKLCKILQQNCEILNLDDFIGKTPLHWAIKTGSEEIVNVLIKNGANMRIKRAYEDCPLSPFYEILRLSIDMPGLIKHVTQEYEDSGMWPDEFGMTRFHVACAIGDLEWIKILLEAGEDITSRMNSDAPLWPGCTPLDVLVKQKFKKLKEEEEEEEEEELTDEMTNQTDAIVFLLNYIYILENMTNIDFFAVEEGLLPFHVSCMAGDSDVVEKFLDLGIDVNISRDCPITYGNVGFFPLHFAVKYGKRSVVELLLQRNINVEAKDIEGNTPLLLAAEQRPEFIDLFIKSNKFDVKTKNLFGETVIDLILDENAMKKIDAIKYLCTLKTDFDTKLNIVRKIVQKIANNDLKSIFESKLYENDVDSNGRNFIHHFVLSSRDVKSKEFARTIEALVRGGCEIDHQDNKGRTSLHYAVLAEDSEKVTALLSIGANINLVDTSGETPVTSAPNRLIDVFQSYVNKLKTVGLYINPLNEKFIQENVGLFIERRISNLISHMFITDSICVEDFLREKMVREFFTFSLDEQRGILDFIEIIYSQKQLLPEWIPPEWIPLFKFQQRQIEKRQKLFQPAINSIQRFYSNVIPKQCLESILLNLSNEDLQNLIQATN